MRCRRWCRASSSLEILTDGSKILLSPLGKKRVGSHGIHPCKPLLDRFLFGLSNRLQQNPGAHAGYTHPVALKAERLGQAHSLAAATPEQLGIRRLLTRTRASGHYALQKVSIKSIYQLDLF